MPGLSIRKQTSSPESPALRPLPCRLARSLATAALAVVLLAFPGATQAARTRPINLEEMTQRADRIFSGRCLSVRVAQDRDLGQVVTYVTFSPHRVEKGDIRGNLTIKLLGDQDEDAPRGAATDGVPTFRKGEEVVLFLHGNSHHGLTSPVGFGQGKFALVKDKHGRSLALNQFANENLFRGLSPGALRRLERQGPKIKEPSGISPDDLLDLVHALR
jgi:hypothetical protein